MGIEAEIPTEFFGDSILVAIHGDQSQIPAPEIPDGNDFYFRIKILYRGTSTAGHETSGLWRFAKGQNSFSFVATGGEQYNYAQ